MLSTTALLRCWNVFEATTELQRFHYCFTLVSTWNLIEGGRRSCSLAEEASSTHAGEQGQPPPGQWLKLPSASPNAERLTAEPQGFCHFPLTISWAEKWHKKQPQDRNPGESTGAQSLSWASDGRQITSFSSPYLAQSSLQTLFYFLTTTTLRFLHSIPS